MISFKRFFPSPITSITGAAAIIAAASFVSRILAVFRDRILASQFGAGDVLDAYYAAFKIPDLIFNLIIVGALSAGFIPVFIAAKQKKGHWYLTNAFITVAGAFLIGVCGASILFVDKLVPLLAPGFSQIKLDNVAALTKIMFLSPILLGFSAILGGVLQSYRAFFIYSLAPIFYNVGIIIGALFLIPFFGVTGLAWGVVLGAVFHFLIQLFAVRHLGWRYKFIWDLKHKGLRLIGKLMVPRTLALGVSQFNVVLLTVVASFLTQGSLAIFNLASNLYFVPIALFGISYALAVFPLLSEKVVDRDIEGFRYYFSSTARQIIFFIVPMTVLFFILRAQIVRIILGSGAFDWTDTVLTFETLKWLSFSLFAQAIIPLLVRSFYAYQNTMTPLLVGLVGDAITFSFSLYLVPYYGVVALGMAFSIGSIAQVVGLWLTLRWKYGSLGEKGIVVALSRFTCAGLLMAFVTQGIKTGIGSFVGTETFISIFVQGLFASVGGLVMYAVVLYLMHQKEIIDLVSGLRKRVRPFINLSESMEEGEGI